MDTTRRPRRFPFVLGVVLAIVAGIVARTRHRRGTRRGSRRLAGAPPPAAPYFAAGERIDIGPRSLYLDCRGSGLPTVVLEAGFGKRQRDLERGPRCARDDDADVRLRPHRAAGGATRAPAHPRRRGRGPAGPAGRRGRAGAVHRGRPLARRRVRPRLRRRRSGGRWPGSCSSTPSTRTSNPPGSTLSSALRGEYETRLDGLRAHVSQVDSLDWPASEAQLRAAALAGLPIEVLVAPRYEPRLDAATNAAIADAWRAAFESLSPGHVTHTTAWGAGHNIQIDRPDLVIEATRRLIALAR